MFGKKLVCATLALCLALSCAMAGCEEAPYEMGVDWAAEYDVIVVGLGAAGCAASITAAQQGAKVLVLEKAPEGHAGGNSAVCMQWAAMTEDKPQAKLYMQSMRGGFETPTDEMIDVYVDGISQNEGWFKDLGAPNVTRYLDWIEFPEMEGSHGIFFVTVDGNTGIPKDGMAGIMAGQGMKPSGAMYKFLKKKAESFENVDIWYEAPAKHLVQDRDTGVVHGVEAEIDGEKVLVRAKNGVVLCCGGYENNPRMLEDFNDVHNSCSQGNAVYNTGDGIVMAQEAGARLWHMANIVWPNNGYQFDSGAAIFAGYTGTALVLGGDGTIYKSVGRSNHGKAYFYGNYVQALYPDVTWAVYDDDTVKLKTVHNSFSEGNQWEIERGYFETADTLEELSAKMGLDAETVKASIETYNAGSERPIVKAPFHAIKFKHTIVNTQGGPERGLGGEVISIYGEPIPHLYEAGELGDVWSHCYQASCNIGGGIAYGRISGANAAEAKADNYQGSVMDGKTPYERVIAEPVFEVGENQYIGRGEGKSTVPMVVRVTKVGDDITDVEVLLDYETDGLTDRAFEQTISQIIEKDTPYVDVVSGCTMTCVGLWSAVNDALSK